VSLRTHLNRSLLRLDNEVGVALLEGVLFECGTLFGILELGDDVVHDAQLN
jgi:hypothetical protein